MREQFIKTLTALARNDSRVILIVGDVGFSFIEDFKAQFPNQFLNVGVLEQSMIGIACGMAKAGWKPYVYTMTNFILLRPIEQVRNDVCYGKANVKLFGVKGSEAYKFLGYSHNMTDEETEGILANLPNLNVYKPQVAEETDTAMRAEYERPGPAYFQI